MMIKYNEQDEQLFQSVSNLMAGDMDSYYTMYELSIKYIYKIIYDIVKDSHTTEDLVQETYITIFNKISTLQDPRKFYSWAGRIATNHTLRYIQSNKRELLVLDAEEGDSDFIFDLASQDNEEFIPENILMDMEKQRLIGEIMDGLSVEQKLAVQYFYFEELSVKEIAELMGCPVGTVKTRLSNARKAIKEAVIDLDVNENTRLYSLSALPIFFIVFKAAVDKFAFAGTVAAGAGVAGEMATGGAAAGGAGVIGEGAAAGGAGVIGEGAAAGGAGTIGGVGTVGEAGVVGGVGTVGEAGAIGGAGVVGEGAVAGGATATGAAATASGVAATGLKGILVKFGTSLGAKIAAGVIATGVVVGGGVAIHNVVTEDKEEPTEITTEVFEEATESDASVTTVATTEAITEDTTEATTEATTEEVAQTATITKAEEAAFMAMVESLLDAQGRIGSGGISSDITEKTVWEFTGHLYNNSMRDQALVKYMPSANAEGAYTLESMQAYANNVFGIENLTFVENYNSAKLSDGTYTFYGIQNGDLNTSRIKTVDIDGDAYTVTGVASIGMMYDLNQQSPAYEPETTYEFTMNLVKNPDSPFGFRLVSISYEQGSLDDLNSSEPPVVNGVAASGDSVASENGDSTVNAASVEMNASVIDPNTTDPTMKKYLEIIDGVCNKGVWPDKAEVQDYEFSDISGNKYGVLDIDGDGRKELVISIQNTSSFAYTLRIYDYDASKDQLTLQFSSNPRIDIYANGALVNKDSSNQSSSVATDISDPTWPYTLYKYDAKTNTYAIVARVQAWNGEWRPDGFPVEYDVDGDKNIYEVTMYKNGDPDSIESSTYMDDSDYREWRKQHFLLDDPVAEYLAEPMSNVLR